ncbi:MAG: hypothetical protein UX07_C0051G0011 [Parcubacteria group bacterium GW2011_GWA2_45_30]|nr:MAG: hypothetical protein UX07_C0051G0011 [Parcubacteria group bacterium GW2011_GWA2_45_30]
MAETSNKFKGEILRQVYRVWLFRKLLPVVIAEIVGFSAVLYILSRTVFIQRVLENAFAVIFAEPGRIVPFAFSAFTNASAGTRILFIVVLVLLAFVMRHLTQGLLRLILVRENYFEQVAK